MGSDVCVLDCHAFVDSLSFHPLSGHRRGSNSTSTAKSLELGVSYDPVVVDLELELHHVATGRRADETGAHVLVLLVQAADVPWVLVMIDDVFVVASSLRSPDRAFEAPKGAASGAQCESLHFDRWRRLLNTL